MFKTHHPICGPVNHFTDNITDIFLRDAVFLFNFCRVSIEIIKDMLVATHRKTIARCIANVFANLSPVFGDAIFSRLIIKKAVYICANDNVQIQIKNIPF